MRALRVPFTRHYMRQAMRLLRTPDLKLLMINGQVNGWDYMEFVSRSKVTPC